MNVIYNTAQKLDQIQHDPQPNWRELFENLNHYDDGNISSSPTIGNNASFAQTSRRKTKLTSSQPPLLNLGA